MKSITESHYLTGVLLYSSIYFNSGEVSIKISFGVSTNYNTCKH